LQPSPTDTVNSGIATYGLVAIEREMSTPPKLQTEEGHFTFYLPLLLNFSDQYYGNPHGEEVLYELNTAPT